MQTALQRPTPPASTSPSRWLWKPRLSAAPRLRLFCLPFAGGSASIFRTWLDRIPADVDFCPIQLPGREGRFGEPSIDQPDALLDALHLALRPWLDCPFVLLGYSMGGLIAHGLAHRLQPVERPLLQRLVVAACSTPEHPAQVDPDRMNRADFLAYLRQLGGTPQEVFEHAELLDMVLPMLQADFRLVARWRVEPFGALPDADPLDCPIVALSASGDAHALPSQMAGWADRTTGAFQHVSVPGGHFALWQQPHLLLDAALQFGSAPSHD